MRWALLHFVDSFDDIEESVGALGLVIEITSSLVGRLQYGVIFEFFKNVFVNIKFLGFVDV